MATDSESFNKDLYDLLKVRGYNPVPLDSKNQRVPASQSADVIQFTFTKDGEEYGKAWLSIDDAQNVIVYYDEEQQESPSDKTPGLEYDDTWTGFLKHLKNWSQRRQLSFELSNKDRLGDDMRQREYYKMKERLGESYHPMGKKASYNDAVPNVKIVLQHNRSLEEGEARFRNVAKIYLENVDGERFLAPTTKPGVARVYARHIAEGGLPNDDKWNHIKSICEDYNKMAGFVRATRNGQFNESAQALVNEGVNHYNNLRETLHKLTTHRGYQAYFESWTPTLMEDELDESINDLFVQEMVDPRIESAMPILSRLKKPVTEMEEVDNLAEWADGIINEKLELDEMDKEHGSKRDFDNPRGPDKTAKPVSVKQFAKGALKSLKRGMKGWEKGMHDVDTVKAATKSLSPDQKEKALAAKAGKGSPAELQQKLIKREKNKIVDEGIVDTIKKGVKSVARGNEANRRKWEELGNTMRAKTPDEEKRHGKASDRYASIAQGKGPFGKGPIKKVDEVLDTRAAKMSYAQKNMDSHKGALDDFMNAGDDEGKKAGAHKTAMKRVRGLRSFVKNKVSKDEVDENFIGMAPQAVAEEEGSGLEAFLKQYPEARDAMRNAVRHFEYAYDAMDHVAGHVLHKMPYKEWEKVRPAIIAYFEKHGLKADANDGVNETRVGKVNVEVTDKGAVYINGTRITGRGTKWGVQNTVFSAKVPKDQVVQTLRDNGFGNIKLDPQYSAEMGITLEEDLGPEQKRVGQLGPTEKVKNNNIGKLVGASESKEMDPELARIIEMAKFKR